MNASNTYESAGVHIGAGNALVERIKPLAKATQRLGAEGGLGGFGGVFDLTQLKYTHPVLVSGADGVGTKLKLAQTMGVHDTIGIDLVAMCVNDILAQGAEPLFFLDYFATSALDVDQAEQVVKGIAAGCEAAGCALIGGETAEMPGMYQKGEYDVAGFAVGIAEKDRLLPREDVAEGDVVIGLRSSGVHSNGFSLVRKVAEEAGCDYAEAAPFADGGASLGAQLLTPTRIYGADCLPLIAAGRVKALAHITGGGITENVPRVLPEHVAAEVDLSAWEANPVFAWLKEAGNIAAEEMLRVFNCGIGMVLVVDAAQQEAVEQDLAARGVEHAVIGQVIPRDDQAVVYKNSEAFLCKS